MCKAVSRLRRYVRFALLALASLPNIAGAGAYDDYFKAIKMDDPRELRILMQRGMGPNMVEPQRGYTALMLAIREDSMQVFKVLFHAPDIDLEARARNGDTALMLAAFHGNLPVVKALLGREVEVNGPGWTPLHYAAINGNATIVQLLLDASAYIDAESPDEKMTPIMLAAMRGRVAAVKMLKDGGADTSLKNRDGLTALDLAKRFDQQEAIEVLTGVVTGRSG